MPTLEDAIALAVEAHRGQKDKAGEPYILHPLRVMYRLGWGAPEAARMAAVLHDVVEDTKFKLPELRAAGYPGEVLAAVALLSRREEDSYEQFIERVLPDPIARMVKRADLEDNMEVRRLGAVTAKEIERLAKYREAWARITQADREALLKPPAP
jgi:(p)ppGpp synthase/HD superfamily hydrolase